MLLTAIDAHAAGLTDLLSKAEFTRQVLVAGQVSIRMKFAKAFSSEHIKRHIHTVDLPLSG